MRRSIQAVFRHGVLEPTEPLDLPEESRLTLQIDQPSPSRFDALFGSISHQDADEMKEAIEEAFEQVHEHNWP